MPHGCGAGGRRMAGGQGGRTAPAALEGRAGGWLGGKAAGPPPPRPSGAQGSGRRMAGGQGGRTARPPARPPVQRPALADEHVSHTATPSTTETATFDELQEWQRPFMARRPVEPINLLSPRRAGPRRACARGRGGVGGGGAGAARSPCLLMHRYSASRSGWVGGQGRPVHPSRPPRGQAYAQARGGPPGPGRLEVCKT